MLGPLESPLASGQPQLPLGAFSAVKQQQENSHNKHTLRSTACYGKSCVQSPAPGPTQRNGEAGRHNGHVTALWPAEPRALLCCKHYCQKMQPATSFERQLTLNRRGLLLRYDSTTINSTTVQQYNSTSFQRRLTLNRRGACCHVRGTS